MNRSRLVKKDLKTVWHPCTQMKDHEKIPMIPIKSGKGVWLSPIIVGTFGLDN